MGHINFDKGTQKDQNWKGFYLALAICLVAIGGIGVATFVSTNGLEQDTESSSLSSSATTAVEDEQVNQIVTNVPDDRTTESTTTTTATTTKTTASDVQTAATAADLFVLPLTNEVTKEYSDGKLVYSTTMADWRVHNGVDFAGQANQSVKALADGTILSIEEDTSWGDIITIDHGYGITSRYCGVEASSITVGKTVKVGEVIGTLTDIPCEISDGPHLHLEILVNNAYVNPIDAIGQDVKITATTAAE